MEEEEECGICFQTLNECFDTEVCDHKFHNRCLCLWQMHSPKDSLECPSCRAVIPKKVQRRLRKFRRWRERLHPIKCFAFNFIKNSSLYLATYIQYELRKRFVKYLTDRIIYITADITVTLYLEAEKYWKRHRIESAQSI